MGRARYLPVLMVICWCLTGTAIVVSVAIAVFVGMMTAVRRFGGAGMLFFGIGMAFYAVIGLVQGEFFEVKENGGSVSRESSPIGFWCHVIWTLLVAGFCIVAGVVIIARPAAPSNRFWLEPRRY